MKKNIVWVICLLPMLLCGKTNNDAYQFVFNLYSNYQNSNNVFSFNGSHADTIFAPELLKLIRLDEKLAHGEVGYLDSDPLCDCQDAGDFKIIKISIFTKTDTTFADLKFKISETNMVLLLKLQQKNGKWLISDIVSSRGSLKDFLSKSLSDNNPNSIYKKQ